jgi:hopene-associated glycosyltransferase HpnB
MTVLAVAPVVALAAWMWLALFRGAYWRADVRLPNGTAPPVWPAVAVVIPARDEAAILPRTLPTVLAQEYAGPLRVILVDDGSMDGTAGAAHALAAASSRPVTVVESGEPSAGWTGKVWALHAGLREAGETDFLLFTDADIAHATDSVTSLVRAADDRDLVSQMARLRSETAWERLIVPAFVYFFALLYPFRWANRPSGRTAAAAGSCVLVRREILERAGGFGAIRGAVIDDVALAKLVKRAGGRIFLGLGDRVESVRPYRGLAALWTMVRRSAYAQLRHSVVLLVGTVLGLAVLFLAPPVSAVTGLLSGSVVISTLGGAGWLLMAGLYVPMLRYYDQSAGIALVLPVVAVLYLAMTVDSALAHYRGAGAAWKGRTYPAPRPAVRSPRTKNRAGPDRH